jgi:uncharacterized repeat protein (TIGR03803 family)
MAQGSKHNCGTVYTVHKSRTGWKAETLWDFGATAGDGCTIWATLAIGANGVLHGTTLTGGAASYGTVFSLTPPAPGSTQWTETVIWSFDGTVGNEPQAGVLIDSAGNLYGTCLGDSTYSNMLVWMLTPPGTQDNGWTLNPLYTTLPHSAIEPTTSALVADASGNLLAPHLSSARFMN